MEPKVTVLMPVYNGERHLAEAIDSILGQSYNNFEFLILNDGSTDRSVEVIESYKDSRIRLVHNERNLKLITTLNKGLDLARGEYIARMDCDDVSLPERLKKQVAFLDKNEDVGICGSWIEVFGDGKWINRYSPDNAAIKCGLLFETQLAHPSVMIRKKNFTTHCLYYDPEYKHAEDYDLWVRSSKILKLANIQSVLVRYRLHSQQVSSLKQNEQLQSVRAIRTKLINYLGIQPLIDELEIHEALCRKRFVSSNEFLERVNIWLSKLKDANNEVGYFPEPDFSRIISKYWFYVCYKAQKAGLSGRRIFWESPLSRMAKATNKIEYWMKFVSKTRISNSCRTTV